MAIPLTLAFWKPKLSVIKERQKKDLVSLGGLLDSHVYIGTIGVL
jgi:hypothetical protein